MLEDKEVLGADIFVIVLLFGNDFGLNSYFLNFFFLSSPKIGHNPHVSYVHMTYVYSFSYVFHFTRSYGQEKSLLYYDLFNFGVLFYGHIPTLIFFFHYPTTPILTVDVFIVRADLQQDVTRT